MSTSQTTAARAGKFASTPRKLEWHWKNRKRCIRRSCLETITTTAKSDWINKRSTWLRNRRIHKLKEPIACFSKKYKELRKGQAHLNENALSHNTKSIPFIHSKLTPFITDSLIPPAKVSIISKRSMFLWETKVEGCSWKYFFREASFSRSRLFS